MDGLPNCSLMPNVSYSLYVYNLNTNSYDCRPALYKTGNSGTTSTGISWSYKIYIDYQDTNILSYMTDDTINGIKTKLDAIVPKTIEVFGAPPQPLRSTEPAIVFFITDIQDNQVVPAGTYVAGFFDSAHNIAGYPYSNGINMLTMDGIAPFEAHDEPSFYNTLAHELQHLIHFGHDRYEETWVDEGLAETSSFLSQETTGKSMFSNGSCSDSANANDYNCSIDEIDSSDLPYSLVTWDDSDEATLVNYYKVAYFFAYLCEKSGGSNGQCPRLMNRIISSTESGASSIDTALNDSTIASAISSALSSYPNLLTLNSGKDYPRIRAMFQAWSVAMSKTAFDTYASPTGDLQNYLYSSFSASYPYWQAETGSGTKYLYSLQPLSAKYYEWTGSGHPDSAFSTTNADIIGSAIIKSDGSVIWNPSQTELNGFTGTQIVYNTNPYYAGTYGYASATNLNSSGTTIFTGTINVLIQKSQSQNLPESGKLTGRLTMIGNMPFAQPSLILADGSSVALDKRELNQFRPGLRPVVEVDYELTGELSRRGQPLLRVKNYQLLP